MAMQLWITKHVDRRWFTKKVNGLLFYNVNATFNNISVISWRSVLLVQETGENHWPIATASHWQTWSHKVVYTSPWAGFKLTTLVVVVTDYIGGWKSNYHSSDHDSPYMYHYVLYLYMYFIFSSNAKYPV